MPSGVARIPEPREWLLTKVCARCGKRKPWAKFSPHTYAPDGSVKYVAAECHDCNNARPPRKPKADRRPYHRAYWRLRRPEGEDLRLTRTPFLAWAEERQAELGGWDALAESTGVESRLFRRLRSGEQSTVRLSTVDRCCVALGFHLTDVYPELGVVA